ncbi:MAG: helix-turn-helix domain-containing protein [Actinoallomurus sp.]
MPDTFRTQRLTRGWTLAVLADRCQARGVKTGKGHLSHIERDDWSPRPPLRAVLCELLDLPITYFDRDQRAERQEA